MLPAWGGEHPNIQPTLRSTYSVVHGLGTEDR